MRLNLLLPHVRRDVFDADSFKKAADENGMKQRVCKSHVRRNTEEWVEKMKPQWGKDADGSLKAIGANPEQAVMDCDELLRLIRERQTVRPPQARLLTHHLDTDLRTITDFVSNDFGFGAPHGLL